MNNIGIWKEYRYKILPADYCEIFGGYYIVYNALTKFFSEIIEPKCKSIEKENNESLEKGLKNGLICYFELKTPSDIDFLLLNISFKLNCNLITTNTRIFFINLAAPNPNYESALSFINEELRGYITLIKKNAEDEATDVGYYKIEEIVIKYYSPIFPSEETSQELYDEYNPDDDDDD